MNDHTPDHGTLRDRIADALAAKFTRDGDVTAGLRRMADEEQPACSCDPAPHREEDGTYSHWAGCPIADAQQRADEEQRRG